MSHSPRVVIGFHLARVAVPSHRSWRCPLQGVHENLVQDGYVVGKEMAVKRVVLLIQHQFVVLFDGPDVVGDIVDMAIQWKPLVLVVAHMHVIQYTLCIFH